ncbi:MAG: peptidoglycan-associated lipoprotein Pal [Proteobacteria bacterium]|nr:peptidoglycan-associated lipoprotein Pal [Pseudomonadota bacterium]
MKFLAVLLGMFILVGMGCAQKAVQISPADQQQLQSVQQGKYDSQSDKKLKDGEVLEEELARRDRDRMRDLSLKDQKSATQFKDVLFDFDSYVIKDEYFRQLNETGNWLKQNKNIIIIIEGHCDEKGTVEYNLALGQKRAEVVKAYLTKSGVDAGRIKTISYGKELPVDAGHTEDSWARNRRANIKID